MSDFPRVTPGQKFQPTAEQWNAAQDAASAQRAKRFGGDAGDAVAEGFSPVVINVKNVSGGALQRFAVVKINDALITPTESQSEFEARVAFDVTTPGAASDYVAILLEPIRSNKIGRAVISGAVQVQVNVTNAGHKYATPTAADATKLTSAAAASQGAVEILWKESGTGTKWAVVRLGTLVAPSGGGGSITVQDDSGSPSYTGITTVQIEPTSAWDIVTSGTVKIFEASATHGGLLTDGSQSICGTKTFVLQPEAPSYYASTGGSSAVVAPSVLHFYTPINVYDCKVGYDETAGSPVYFKHDCVNVGSPFYYVRTSLAVSEPNGGTPTTADVKLGAWATVSGLVFCGGLYISGSLSVTPQVQQTSSSGDPNFFTIPNNGDMTVHKNTTSGNVFFAYNDGGSVVKVQLT